MAALTLLLAPLVVLAVGGAAAVGCIAANVYRFAMTDTLAPGFDEANMWSVSADRSAELAAGA
jgi:hypothetical protein